MIQEQEIPMPMRIYIRSKHHYANHSYNWTKNEEKDRYECEVLDKDGEVVYNYYYPADYYVTMNEELKFNDYNVEWLGL